ncbi:MAG: hypothetical protein KDA27_27570 [Candidatus Eisenbacteria bacterium]|uniref:Uncharacterized protein n=1 Tax=Eiseniibacteriota bacterium TaxID=2212470 RepID=A0A956NJ77_UNCEI|nr:hypothetical protein [Candidatus Eisenbacteria bacterium]MCB9462792.1 hypothetical protein [Candidatus Eisenbacteria bacterium]
MRALVEAAAGPEPRPSALGRRLTLDKSLASRLVRAVSAGSEPEFLHYVPSPAGLQILIEAARSGEMDPAIVDRLDSDVDRFRDLLNSLSGGRADLEALISDEASQVRQRAMRSASQSIFRGTSALLGYESASLSSALLVVPSAHPDYLDAVEVQQRVAIRRLRPTAAIGVLRVAMTAPSWDGEDGLSFLTVEGNPIRRPEDVILADHSDATPSEFEVVGDGEDVTLILAEEQAALRDPITVTSALRMQRAFHRYRTDEAAEGVRTYRIQIPCKRMVRTVFIHDDCHCGPPVFTFELPRPGRDTGVREEGLLARVGSIDLDAPVAALGRGIRNAGIRGIPRFLDALRDVFRRADLPPGQFHGYSIDVPYPVAFVHTRCWLPLEEPTLPN